jgi:hypothetical protein
LIGKGNYLCLYVPVPNSEPINDFQDEIGEIPVENDSCWETSAQAVVRKRGSELSRTTHVSRPVA